jgi:HSP20 family molecular chaperone IbpA
MYTLTTFNDLIGEILTERKPFRPRNYQSAYSNFDVTLIDGKQQVTIPVTGHNPKDISVDVTETEIVIKSSKGENTSHFVRDIDLTLSVGDDYDGTKSEAKFENGLLTLLIDKKKERKAKSLKISY